MGGAPCTKQARQYGYCGGECTPLWSLIATDKSSYMPCTTVQITDSLLVGTTGIQPRITSMTTDTHHPWKLSCDCLYYPNTNSVPVRLSLKILLILKPGGEYRISNNGHIKFNFYYQLEKFKCSNLSLSWKLWGAKFSFSKCLPFSLKIIFHSFPFLFHNFLH